MKLRAALLLILSLIVLSSCNYETPPADYITSLDIPWNITLLQNNQCSWNDGKTLHEGTYSQFGNYIAMTIPLSGNQSVIFYGELKDNQLILSGADFNIHMTK